MKGVKVNNAKLHRIIDGDTFQIYLPVCCFESIFTCRLNGVDTPELHSKDENEKKNANNVKEYVETMLSTQKFSITCGEFDKYGRILCDIFLQLDDKTISLADILISKKYAISYSGGKKQK